MGFCECTAKFALFVFNLVCALLGLVIIGISVATNLHGKPFKDILHGQITTVSIVLIVIGVLVFLIAFLGCCGAVKESNCMLTTYAVILTTLLIIQIAIGITAFVYKSKVEESIGSALENAFENNNPPDVVDSIQRDIQCCGLDGPHWWKFTLPPSCCGLDSGNLCTIVNAYPSGCRGKLFSIINHSLKLLGGIALGIAIIELICVIFAFCLSSSFKKWSYR